jgi:hypothetical protein
MPGARDEQHVGVGAANDPVEIRHKNAAEIAISAASRANAVTQEATRRLIAAL